MAFAPPAIPVTPTVRVVHPSGTLDGHIELLRAGIARLSAAGCTVRHDEARARATWRGYLAGPDQARVDELVDALTEPGVDVVWLGRGGSGAARIADAVVDAMRGRPVRALVGFSDATTLLNRLASELGWISFHGPVVTSLGRREPVSDLDAILATLRGERTEVSVPRTDGPDVEGVLYGGNLTVLASLAGTGAWPSCTDPLWLLEEVGEPPYRIDRCFWQLRSSGALANAAGVWVGDLGVAPEHQAACIEAMRDDAGEVPVVGGAPAGHRGTIDLLPIGARVRLRPRDGVLAAVEPWVEAS